MGGGVGGGVGGEGSVSGVNGVSGGGGLGGGVGGEGSVSGISGGGDGDGAWKSVLVKTEEAYVYMTWFPPKCKSRRPAMKFESLIAALLLKLVEVGVRERKIGAEVKREPVEVACTCECNCETAVHHFFIWTLPHFGILILWRCWFVRGATPAPKHVSPRKKGRGVVELPTGRQSPELVR